MGKEIVNQVQEAQRKEAQRNDKPTKEHTETHSNQTDKVRG